MAMPLDGYARGPYLYEALIDGQPGGPLFTDEASANEYTDRLRDKNVLALVMKVPTWKRESTE